MKFLITTTYFLLFTCSLTAQLTIQSPEGLHIPTNALEQRIAFLMDSADIPGLSLAIINEQEIVYYQVFGVQNAETQVPISKQNIFEGASLSKPLFAYFAMKMHQRMATS